MRSASCEGKDVEGKHNMLLPTVLAQRHVVPRVRAQGKVWGFLTYFYHYLPPSCIGSTRQFEPLWFRRMVSFTVYGHQTSAKDVDTPSSGEAPYLDTGWP